MRCQDLGLRLQSGGHGGRHPLCCAAGAADHLGQALAGRRCRAGGGHGACRRGHGGLRRGGGGQSLRGLQPPGAGAGGAPVQGGRWARRLPPRAWRGGSPFEACNNPRRPRSRRAGGPLALETVASTNCSPSRPPRSAVNGGWPGPRDSPRSAANRRQTAEAPPPAPAVCPVSPGWRCGGLRACNCDLVPRGQKNCAPINSTPGGAPPTASSHSGDRQASHAATRGIEAQPAAGDRHGHNCGRDTAGAAETEKSCVRITNAAGAPGRLSVWLLGGSHPRALVPAGHLIRASGAQVWPEPRRSAARPAAQPTAGVRQPGQPCMCQSRRPAGGRGLPALPAVPLATLPAPRPIALTWSARASPVRCGRAALTTAGS